MKTVLLTFAVLMTAAVAMAADGGTITFKTYLSGSNNMKAMAWCWWSQISISTADGWWCTLLDRDFKQVMGTKVGTSSVAPVVAAFHGETGWVPAGGDWALRGFDQGKSYDFAIACWLDSAGTGVFSTSTPWNASGLYPVMLGGIDLVPPTPPGMFAFGGAQSMVSPCPEPSVLSLGVLGIGAFLMKRQRR